MNRTNGCDYPPKSDYLPKFPLSERLIALRLYPHTSLKPRKKSQYYGVSVEFACRCLDHGMMLTPVSSL